MSEYRNGYPPLLHLEGRGLPIETLHSSGYDQHLYYGCRSTIEMERWFLKWVGQWYTPLGQNTGFLGGKAVCTCSARPFSAELADLALSVSILSAFPDWTAINSDCLDQWLCTCNKAQGNLLVGSISWRMVVHHMQEWSPQNGCHIKSAQMTHSKCLC